MVIIILSIFYNKDVQEKLIERKENKKLFNKIEMFIVRVTLLFWKIKNDHLWRSLDTPFVK